MRKFTLNHRHMMALLLLLCLPISTLLAQTPAQRKAISQQYNQSTLERLEQDYHARAIAQKAEALRVAAEKGWDILKTNDDGSFDELIAVSPDGHPIYYTIYNVDAARSTRTNHLNIGGSLGLSLDGQNMTAHVWDGGATRVTHQEFDGPGGNNRVTINDGVTTLNGNSFHAQHVTGTIVASGVVAAAKGMAPQARALTHDWNNDLAEATTEAANGMLVSNHSYGYRASLVPDWYFGAYLAESRDWDALMYNSPFYLMVVAAGNDGNDNSSNAAPLAGQSSFDKLTGHSTSKNNMVVANGQDANVNADGTLNSVLISSSSSEGPTDDYRIKPDITGNGSGVYSTYDGSDTQYNSISGTSMASPNVAGSLLLLQQHYNNLNGSFMRSATLKGLALHTADDAGITGPDAVYGWGLMNTKAAAEAISDNGNGSIVDELTLAQGGSYTITVDSDGSSPLIASISWTDPAGTANTGTTNLSTPVLVNDLDIRVTQGGTTYNPYYLTGVNSNSTGDNVVDPFERVNVSGASGSYTITVTHKGSLSGGSQNFSLVVTGVTGTPPVCNATTPTGVSNSSVGTSSATVSWNAVAGATYDVRHRVAGGTWSTQTVSGTSVVLSGLNPATSYEAQVRSKCPDASVSAYSASTTFTTGDGNCTGGTSSFPYNESFENTLGTWSQSTADDINWTINSGGTPSSGTGPTAASDGTYYIYMEVSGSGTGFPTKRAILTSSCFDLSAASSATASFDYQMTGGNVGSVALEISDNNGDTWTSVWSVSGDQGAAWNSASVDLSSYAGGTFLLRFNGISGASWDGDIAIDKFALTTGSTPPPPGGCSSSVALPYADGFESDFGGWTQSSSDDFDWSRNSGGTPSSNTGPTAADEGSWYLYIESSSPNYSNFTATIESPCFAIPTGGATFNFRYHMYGAAAMGGLVLEASADNGSTWSNIWSVTGNQGNSWLSASVSLAAYAGGDVKLRFAGTTGTTWQGDMAIDALSITTGGTPPPSQTTVTLTLTFDNYPEETSWDIKDGATVIASGGTYPTQPDGSTITETANLDAGCYTFTIYDSYGDGICCTYGSGSYSLADGGTTLASGGSFGSLETTNFCVGGATQSAYVVSTESIGQPVSFEMFPNPVSGSYLNVVSSREGLKYNISTLTGQLISAGDIENSRVNVAGLNNGIYLITIRDGEKSFTRKFVKQ